MKNSLLLILILLSAEAYSEVYRAKVYGTSCNTEFGIGEVTALFRNVSSRSMFYGTVNVVNDELCGKGTWWKTAPLITIGVNGILGGQFFDISMNSKNIALTIKEINYLPRRERKALIRNVEYYSHHDHRWVNSDELSLLENREEIAEEVIYLSLED